MSTATVEIFRNASQRLGVLSGVSLIQARINANSILESLGLIHAYAIIRDGDHVEKFRGNGLELPTNDWLKFPLANICRGGDRRLARHFQMAGAVDQARIERLVIFMCEAESIAAQEQFKIEFLDPEVASARVHQGREYRNTNQGGVSDSELDAYRNSNQY